jgi:hypothetical protein
MAFPSNPDEPIHKLQIDTATANMVLKGWRTISRVPSQQISAPPVIIPLSQEIPSVNLQAPLSCIDQEPHAQVDESRSSPVELSAAQFQPLMPSYRMTSPALHFDSDIHMQRPSTVEQPSVIPVLDHQPVLEELPSLQNDEDDEV